MEATRNPLACPNCGNPCRLTPTTAACDSCNAEFPLKNDVIDFRHPGSDSASRDQLDRVLSAGIVQLRAGNWMAMLQQLTNGAAARERLMEQIVDDSKYAWKIFLQASPGQVLLDIGSGLGSSTKNLASQFEPNTGTGE